MASIPGSKSIVRHVWSADIAFTLKIIIQSHFGVKEKIAGQMRNKRRRGNEENHGG
jgi:hypothetical protein